MKKYCLILTTALLLTACGEKEKNSIPTGDPDGDTPEAGYPEGDTPEAGDPDDDTPEASYAVGEVLPAWEEGCLDIHAINSGRGECYFYIFPDGTTLVADAGEVTASGSGNIPRKPDEGTRPYVTYGNYIRHFLPAGAGSVDYMYLTHFHIDHMGELNSAYPLSEGGYRPSGVSALYDLVPFNTLLDRGYPGYGSDPGILAPGSTATDNYITFVNYATAQKGLKAQRIEVGSDKQVVLLKDNSYDFTFTNIVGNGQYLSKDAGGNRVVKKVSITDENPASCGFHLRYGKFDYIACGDLTSGPQNRMALYYQDYVGSLEAFKANHHLSANSWGSQMQKSSFSPRVILNESFTDYQPDADLLANILSGQFENNTVVWTKDIFLTNAHETAIAAHPDLYAQCHCNGHVVLRVSPGGDSFSVYMLDDSDFSYRIKSIHGPYSCQ